MTGHVRLTADERERRNERARDPEGAAARDREREAERIISRRIWAAVVLTGNVDVFVSVVAGRAVLAYQLDGEALRRAMRGSSLPRPDTFIEITADMLDAVAEGGPFTQKESGR